MSSRRRFLARTATLGAGFSLPPVASTAFSQPAGALVPRRVYFVQSDYANVQLSPDGEQLAYLAPVNGVRNLFVAPAAAPQKGRQVTRVTDRDVRFSYAWAHTGRHLVFFQERDGDENWRASSVDIATGAIKALTPERGVRSWVQETSHLYPDEILVNHNERDRSYFDLYRVNVVSGASTLVYENREFAWLVTDSAFRLRLGGRYAADGSAEILERSAEGAWKPFLTVPIGDLDALNLVDFSEDGKTLYMIDTRGRDKAALVAIDMATRRSSVLAQDAEADIVRLDLDRRTRRPLAALAVKDRSRWHALDAGTRQDLERLERDTQSGEFALLDRPSGRIEPLYKLRAALDSVGLRPMEPVVIRARDGLELNSYLTLPSRGAQAAQAPLPMVLAIHGGPYWRDSWGFSGTHQFLANRGYAVLSVNFRGSTGFGKRFVTAADKEWGGRMHDDLIDAVDWAVARGIADPKRVGFLGASYGGYSALMAASPASSTSSASRTCSPSWRRSRRTGDRGSASGRIASPIRIPRPAAPSCASARRSFTSTAQRARSSSRRARGTCAWSPRSRSRWSRR